MVAVVVIQGGRLVMVLDFNSINTVSTLRSSADAVRVRRHMGRPNETAAALLPQMSVEMAPTRRTEIATLGDVVAAVTILV